MDFPMIQIREPSLREVNYLTPGHIASKLQGKKFKSSSDAIIAWRVKQGLDYIMKAFQNLIKMAAHPQSQVFKVCMAE